MHKYHKTKQDKTTLILVVELCDTLEKTASAAIQRQKEALEDIQTKLGFAASRLDTPSQGMGAYSHISIDSAVNAEYHCWEKEITIEFLEELKSIKLHRDLVVLVERKKASVSSLTEKLREVTRDCSDDVMMSVVGLSDLIRLRREFVRLELTQGFVNKLQKIADKAKGA